MTRHGQEWVKFDWDTLAAEPDDVKAAAIIGRTVKAVADRRGALGPRERPAVGATCRVCKRRARIEGGKFVEHRATLGGMTAKTCAGSGLTPAEAWTVTELLEQANRKE